VLAVVTQEPDVGAVCCSMASLANLASYPGTSILGLPGTLILWVVLVHSSVHKQISVPQRFSGASG
jgi:hypothetical protein